MAPGTVPPSWIAPPRPVDKRRKTPAEQLTSEEWSSRHGVRRRGRLTRVRGSFPTPPVVAYGLWLAGPAAQGVLFEAIRVLEREAALALLPVDHGVGRLVRPSGRPRHQPPHGQSRTIGCQSWATLPTLWTTTPTMAAVGSQNSSPRRFVRRRVSISDFS